MSIKKWLQNWLEIKRPNFTREADELKKEFEQDLWKLQQVVKPIVMARCSKCGQRFRLWPYEEAAYYIERDSQTFSHKDCPPKPQRTKGKK